MAKHRRSKRASQDALRALIGRKGLAGMDPAAELDKAEKMRHNRKKKKRKLRGQYGEEE